MRSLQPRGGRGRAAAGGLGAAAREGLPPARRAGLGAARSLRPTVRGGGHSCGCGLVSTVSWGVGVVLKLAPPPPAMRVAHRLLLPSVFLFRPGTCTWMSPQKSVFRCPLVA